MNFENKDVLKSWLSQQSRNTVSCFTVRAALREIPTLWFVLNSSKSDQLSKISLAVLRALAVSLYCTRFGVDAIEKVIAQEAYTSIFRKDLRFMATRNAHIAISSIVSSQLHSTLISAR